jgi:hypothetical protein
MHKTLVCVLALLSANGAFAHKGSINDEERELIRKAKVLVLVDQDKARAGFMESRAGQNYGLIGFGIDVIDNHSRFKQMNEELLPLQSATADLNFSRDFVAQLKGLKIFDPTRIEVVAKRPENSSQLNKLIAAAGDPTVVIDATALLSPTLFRSLTVEATMSLWSGKKKSKPMHTLRVNYVSEPVSTSQTWQQESFTLPRWLQNNARRYRSAYGQGIGGSIDLLVKAMSVSEPAGAKRESRPTYTGGAMNEPQHGYLVEETSERVELLDEGTLYSLPVLPTFATLAKDIKPVKPNEARLYLYRAALGDTFFIDPTFYSNGATLGNVHFRTYRYIDVAPGRYTLRAKYDGNSPGATIAAGQIDKTLPIEIDAVGGQEYFIRYNGYKGVWTKDDMLMIADPSAARAEIQTFLPMR